MNIRDIIREEFDDLAWMRDTEPFNINKGNFIVNFCDLVDLQESVITDLLTKFFNSVGEGVLWDSYTSRDMRMFIQGVIDDGAVFYVVNDKDSTDFTYGWDDCGVEDVDTVTNREGWPNHSILEIIDQIIPKYDRVNHGTNGYIKIVREESDDFDWVKKQGIYLDDLSHGYYFHYIMPNGDKAYPFNFNIVSVTGNGDYMVRYIYDDGSLQVNKGLMDLEKLLLNMREDTYMLYDKSGNKIHPDDIIIGYGNRDNESEDGLEWMDDVIPFDIHNPRVGMKWQSKRVGGEWHPEIYTIVDMDNVYMSLKWVGTSGRENRELDNYKIESYYSLLDSERVRLVMDDINEGYYKKTIQEEVNDFDWADDIIIDPIQVGTKIRTAEGNILIITNVEPEKKDSNEISDRNRLVTWDYDGGRTVTITNPISLVRRFLDKGAWTIVK